MSSEKHLGEAEWKKFSKGRDYKDGAWLKALAALEKAEKAGPQAELEAMDALEREAAALLKSAKGDKELAGYLDEVDKAVRKARKAAEKAAEAEADESEDEEETPALLTTKMVPLLRQVPKGQVLHVMIALAGKDAAVLVSRKPIGPPRRKLLSEYLGVGGGVKYITGQCLFEAKAHTFVMNTQAAGLAKKVKAALLQQTGQRYKVRVRGDDPNDIDEDLEADAEDGEQGESEGEQSSAASPQQLDYERRMAELEPRLLKALQAQGADATKLRGLAEFAREKADAGNHAAALQSLAMIEKLLAAPAGSGDSAALAAALDGWANARDAAVAELKQVARDIAELKDPESAQGVIEITAVVKNLGAAPPRTRAQVDELQRYLDQDDVVLDVCDFATDIRTPLLAALTAVQRALPA